MNEPGTELVRCSTELVEELVADKSAPVVVVSISRHDDGTAELNFRTPEVCPSCGIMPMAACDPTCPLCWAHSETHAEEWRLDMLRRRSLTPDEARAAWLVLSGQWTAHEPDEMHAALRRAEFKLADVAAPVSVGRK